VYGIELYEAIRNAKAVLNNFTDLSVGFHSNMRIFETIGNGTPLISPMGEYPDGLRAGTDFLPYQSVDDVSRIIKSLKSEPEEGLEFARSARSRAFENFSKERQYARFCEFATSLG